MYFLLQMINKVAVFSKKKKKKSKNNEIKENKNMWSRERKQEAHMVTKINFVSFL